ncbi:Uncharacterized protein PCOAH_00009260 [Plasmodium coatneyi]|uniref:RNA polymerase II subunit B1 CTD phosphatase RPAP2 homolog n=1 Tax=Plasmodium coatneyi TaxID=208452 RepID=A0A1B1DUG6_9APIC|nr:Uncharacterized protein PCOAH_00009260 [Plasmodium coatneyi]ANQ06384.1 Uncharacterized protein PCOAH_00009260 [Plasmodium coatneyi]
MNAQIRKKKNLLEREAKLNNLAKIFHRKLETLLIYIRVPKKKQEKLFFDDFFNVEEVSAYINTVVDDEHRTDVQSDHQEDRPCSGESLNLNADNEIKTSKDIFIKNLLIFLNNLIVLYFSKSNLIDVCINRRSFNKCGFYACDNIFLNNPNKGKYKIDAKSKNIYLREYYDLFCSASCMNYNLHLLKEIAKNGNNAKGGKQGKTNLKTKCQLIYIMFLTFFPIFKFHDINVLLNNLELVYIQGNKIFLKPGGGKADINGEDKKESTNDEGKVCTIRTVKDGDSQKTHQLRKALFPIIVEKQEGCEDSEEKVTEESPEGNSSNGEVISNHMVSNHALGETSNERDGNEIVILPLEESLGGYDQVKAEKGLTNRKVDSCPKREQGKANKCKNVTFNEDIQTFEYYRNERVDVCSVAGTSMETSHVGTTQGGDCPPSGDILCEDSLSGENEHKGNVHPRVPPEWDETTMRRGPGEGTNELSVKPQYASDKEVEGTIYKEALGERNPSDGEITEVYEQVRQCIFTNRKHFFEDILGKTLFDSNKVIGFDYEGKEEEPEEKKKTEMVKEAKKVEQTEEKEAEQVEKKAAMQEKTESDVRVCAAQRMSEINLKHDRERRGRRIVLLSSPSRGRAMERISQANEGEDSPKDDEAEAMGAISDGMEGKEEDAALGDEEKERTVQSDKEKEDTVPVDEKRNDDASADGGNEDTSSYGDKNATAGGGENAPASDTDEDNTKLQNLLIKKKEKISEQYNEAFNRCMPPFLFAGEYGGSRDGECPGDPIEEEGESSDDEKRVQQVKWQNKYTYSTEKCSAYEDMSLYVVLWDILTGIISKYTVYYFQRSDFVIPKCPTEVERDRKNEFLRNVSQHMPKIIHPIASTIFNVCQTFSFGKPLLPFKKIIYESIIYVIAAALGRHKVELIPSEEMANIRKAEEEFLTLENGVGKEELDELTMLFYQHFYY